MDTYTLSQRVLFRGLEGNYIKCDLPLHKARTITDLDGNKKRVPASKIENARLKLQDNNVELLEKIKGLPRRRLIWITYIKEIPLGNKTDDITVIKILTNPEYLKLEKPYKEKSKQLMKENMKQLYKEILNK